jgi:nicotinic acid mononucleotide adenylyltransferase
VLRSGFVILGLERGEGLAFGHLAENRVRVRAIEDIPAARAGLTDSPSTYDCLKHLEAITNDEYSFVIGYDQAIDIASSRWSHSTELTEQFQLIVGKIPI